MYIVLYFAAIKKEQNTVLHASIHAILVLLMVNGLLEVPVES